VTETKPAWRDSRMATRWQGLSPTNRRRIVLGALLAASLAARDAVLFLVSAGLFALSEMAPTRAPTAAPA
jgi:hypothetical protein